jgi:hypothetical protein
VRVKAYPIERKIDALNLNALAIESDFIDNEGGSGNCGSRHMVS